MSKHWPTSHTTGRGESFLRMPSGFGLFLYPCLSSTSAGYHSTWRTFRSFVSIRQVFSTLSFFPQFLPFLGHVRFVRCVSSSTCRFDAYVSFLSWGRAWIFGLIRRRAVVVFFPSVVCKSSSDPFVCFASTSFRSGIRLRSSFRSCGRAIVRRACLQDERSFVGDPVFVK